MYKTPLTSLLQTLVLDVQLLGRLCLHKQLSRLKSEHIENQQTLVINNHSAIIIIKRDEGRGKLCLSPRERIRKE